MTSIREPVGVASRFEIRNNEDLSGDLGALLHAGMLDRAVYRVFDTANNYVDIGLKTQYTPSQKAAIALRVTESNPGYRMFREIV